jgi:hypothetical protein
MQGFTPAIAHHDYIPGSKVQVMISGKGWRAATFIGTSLGAQMSALPFLVVQTRDGEIHTHCSPEYVRAAR